MERIMTGEGISQAVHRLNLQNEAVVMGQGALVAVGAEAQGVHGDLELAVNPATYRALRATNGWRDDIDHLQSSGVRVHMSGADVTAERGFQLGGVQYEGLPDVYGLAQDTGDNDTTTTVRNHLLNPTATLPAAVLLGELAELQSMLPERLHDRPELIVAAHGLFTVRTLFGSLADAHSVRTYQGDYEDQPVAAMYHNYEHTRYDVVGGVIEHAERSGQLSDKELLAAIAAAATHDNIMGHGRQADNPEGYDELRSADLVRERMLVQGASEQQATDAYLGVLATAFNESTGGQNVQPDAGALAVQVSVSSADLSRASTQYGTHNGFLWPLEHGQLRNGGQYLNELRASNQRNWGSNAPEDLLAAIDDNNELRAAFGRTVATNGNFIENIAVPSGWSLDSSAQRRTNAATLRRIGQGIVTGTSARDEYVRLQRENPAPWNA